MAQGARETVDGATREREIDLKDKVQKMLEEGAAGAAASNSEDGSDETKPEDTGAGDTSGQQQSGEEQGGAADDDVIEYEVGGEKKSLRLSEVAKNPAARQALSEQLARSHAQPQRVVDEEQTRHNARQLQIQADIDRGLLRVNPQTGQLEETRLLHRLREQDSQEPRRPRGDEGDPLDLLDANERTEYEASVKRATEEGDSEALKKSHRLAAVAASRAGQSAARAVENNVRRHLEAQDQATAGRNEALNNRRVVDQEIAKFPHAFGAYDPATGRFANERAAQVARNQVATALELTKTSKVDARHLAQIAATADLMKGTAAPSAANNTTQQQQTKHPAPPPATGRGARVPPGPPPKTGSQAPGKAADGQTSNRPKLGSTGMVDAVTKRLQQLASS